MFKGFDNILIMGRLFLNIMDNLFNNFFKFKGIKGIVFKINYNFKFGV
jgi:hypothetical protein